MNFKFQKIGIWLINLPANRDRLEKMTRQLDAMNLPWKLFVAVDGKKSYEQLIVKADPLAYAKNMGSPILPGKLGVFASHMGVWADFLETGYEHALILKTM